MIQRLGNKFGRKIVGCLTVMLGLLVGNDSYAGSVSASPSPACVGTEITITVSGVTECEGLQVSAKLGDTSVSLTKQSDGVWAGTTTPSTAGIFAVTASDNCGDTFDSCDETVVQLNDIELTSDPAVSGWTHEYPNRNYTALKSAYFHDVVTFAADITPATAEAATLLSWTGATPWPDNLTATCPAGEVAGPTTVTVSACNDTADPYKVWIFWGSVSYNFSGDLASDNNLTFGNFGGIPLPNPRRAGPALGSITIGSGPSVTLGIAFNKVEIIGTLVPSGIGSIVGNIFSFNPQRVDYYLWNAGATSPTGMDGHQLATVTGSTPGTHYGPRDDVDIPQQTAPVSDRIYAIDAPGVGEVLPVTGYEANAANFINYIYIGSVKASDASTWNSRVRATFSGNSVAASPCSASSGNPDLPTTWGDSNW